MRFGLALGGGFARGLAHIGVLRVLERNRIPIRCTTGVGAMRFTDVARWTIGRMGIAGTDLMERFLHKLLKCYTFEQMRIPLGMVATGEGVIFRDRGDMVLPIRASSLHLPMQGAAAMPTNMFHVINRCFQILRSRIEISWRQPADLVIEPDVCGME